MGRRIMTHADGPDFSEIIGVFSWFLERYDQAPLIGHLVRINLTISPAFLLNRPLEANARPVSESVPGWLHADRKP